MKKNNKAIIWLCIFIFLILVFTIIGTYSILNIGQVRQGTFNVEITSKGVDIFSLPAGDDVHIEANVYNFRKDKGHNIAGETYIRPTLETTKKESQICYEISVTMPDKQIFEYSPDNINKTPELLMDVLFSNDGSNYDYIIENKDITTSTGTIKIPKEKNSDDYKNIIATTKNVKTVHYWKLKTTFVYLPNIDQQVNDGKNYNISINANVVEC